MKKTKSKLQLKTNTIRVLQGSALAQVHGGNNPGGGNNSPRPQAGPTANCTMIGAGCSHPPEHTPGSTNNGN